MTADEIIDYLKERGWTRSIDQRKMMASDREPRQVFVWKHPDYGESGCSSDAAQTLARAVAVQIKMEGDPSSLELQLRSWLNAENWRYRRSFGDIGGNKHHAELHIFEKAPPQLEEVLERIAAQSGGKIADDVRQAVAQRLEENPGATLDDLDMHIPQYADLKKFVSDPNRLVPLLPTSRVTGYDPFQSFISAIVSQLWSDGYKINIYEPPTRGRKLADMSFEIDL